MAKAKSGNRSQKKKPRRGQVFIVSGPSGAGKGTIIRKALARLKKKAVSSVSLTTREPRDGEVNGIDYCFTNKAEFKRMVKSGVFLEWAKVHGEFYGTSTDHVLDHLNRGTDVILDIDVQGCKQIRKRGFGDTDVDVHTIFVLPPSYAALKKRLLGRGQSNNLELRIKNAKKEISQAHKFQHFVVNEDGKTSAATRRLLDIISNARKAQKPQSSVAKLTARKKR